MYFKQLEMVGFKSFADRTVLRLEPGITSVVGPNGCGKSNILDAIRWCLGEQRAKELRGGSMQDVIFNGTDTRHAMGMAEVSITFDNADSSLPVDFAEVEITRRVYRSGESEYLINKAPCRLADVREMFMDTGIGTAAYSMVGQGKMDQLLSAKADERRAVFEEAAGVHKYKNRKRIALRRLESAEQNILRLADIIAEVQRQMRNLKRQVNAAIRYREISENLREFEIRAAWIQFAKLSEEIARLKGEFTEAQKTYESLSTETTTLEARSEEMNLAKLELQRMLTARREGVHELGTNMEKIERQLALLRQQIDFALRQKDTAGDERKSYLERSEEIRTQLAATIERAGALQTDIAAQQQALETRVGEHGALAEAVTAAEAAVQAVRDKISAQTNQRAETLTEVETLGVRVSSIDSQIEAICGRRDADNAKREQLAGGLQEAQTAEAEKQKALAEVEETRANATTERQEKEAALKEIDAAWQNSREEKSRTEARLHSLRELRDNYEGFAHGVRAVMKAKSSGLDEAKGVVGPAGDLISTEKTYERAIEAALGGNINNVIVKDADGAREAIDFLKRHKAGRVTFLPLDIIRGGRGDEGAEIRHERGVIGPALEVVQFDASLQLAVEYLLHSTVIVETIEDAIRIARNNRRYPRLVTLDGDVVSSSGAVTGGNTKHETRGLLGRSAEITELEQRAVAAEKEQARLGGEREALQKAIYSLAETMRNTEAQAASLRREAGQLGVVIARHTTELESLKASIDNLAAQQAVLAAQRIDLDSLRLTAMSRAEDLQTGDEALQRELAEAQQRAHDARQTLSVRANELADLRVEIAALTQRLEETQRDAQREKREYETALHEAERRTGMDSELDAQVATLEEEVAINIERAKSLSEDQTEAKAKVVEAENHHRVLLEESEAVDKRLRELRDHNRAAQSKLHQVELDLRRDEERIGFFQERILTEYNIALPSLKAEDVGTDDLEDGAREKFVADLRQQLQRMGDVNLMAIEEYEELEKRADFLVGQLTDLTSARDMLMGVVARSDKKIREMFMEVFEEIGNNFRETFRRLFNGGQARVYLLDEDDPLESGIEIEARPPGKKPTSISLLSGGERALTAVALLFAIFKAKPSPFCILDEVDAPLDDANISRFCEMVLEFSNSSQFVVITHSKQTMSHADVLYGVTQHERGVSELVSVKFEEHKSTPAA